MTFTLTGLNTKWTRNAAENPTLEVPLGSVVQIVLENDGPVPHQFAISDFDVRSEILNQEDRLTAMSRPMKQEDSCMFASYIQVEWMEQ